MTEPRHHNQEPRPEGRRSRDGGQPADRGDMSRRMAERMAERRRAETARGDTSRTEPRRSDLRRPDMRLDQPREAHRLTLPRFNAEAFGRWSEGIARFMGTAWFIVYMTVVIALWFGWNTLAPASWRFDPYTFTFLTLVLSLQASYAAPLILLAQNRQADRDRVSLEEDRRRASMQKADTEYLSREIASLRIALGEVVTRDFLRSELTRLIEDLDEAENSRSRPDRRGGSRGDDRRPGRRADDPDAGEYLDDADTAADRGAGSGSSHARRGR